MKRIIQIMMILLIALFGCKKERASRYYQKAYDLEGEDRYEEAIKELDKAIELNPNFEQAYLDRAIDKSILGDFEGAIEDLDVLIELRPDGIEPYICRAEYKRMLEQYEDALEDVESALKLKSSSDDYTKLMKNLNYDILENENFDIELEYILYERACSNYGLENYNIIDDLNYCIHKKIMIKECLYMRGMIYLGSNKQTEGCADLHEAEKLEEGYTQVLIEQFCN